MKSLKNSADNSFDFDDNNTNAIWRHLQSFCNKLHHYLQFKEDLEHRIRSAEQNLQKGKIEFGGGNAHIGIGESKLDKMKENWTKINSDTYLKDKLKRIITEEMPATLANNWRRFRTDCDHLATKCTRLNKLQECVDSNSVTKTALNMVSKIHEMCDGSLSDLLKFCLQSNYKEEEDDVEKKKDYFSKIIQDNQREGFLEPAGNFVEKLLQEAKTNIVNQKELFNYIQKSVKVKLKRWINIWSPEDITPEPSIVLFEIENSFFSWYQKIVAILKGFTVCSKIASIMHFQFAPASPFDSLIKMSTESAIYSDNTLNALRKLSELTLPVYSNSEVEKFMGEWNANESSLQKEVLQETWPSSYLEFEQKSHYYINLRTLGKMFFSSIESDHYCEFLIDANGVIKTVTELYSEMKFFVTFQTETMTRSVPENMQNYWEKLPSEYDEFKDNLEAEIFPNIIFVKCARRFDEQFLLDRFKYGLSFLQGKYHLVFAINATENYWNKQVCQSAMLVLLESSPSISNAAQKEIRHYIFNYFGSQNFLRQKTLPEIQEYILERSPFIDNEKFGGYQKYDEFSTLVKKTFTMLQMEPEKILEKLDFIRKNDELLNISIEDSCPLFATNWNVHYIMRNRQSEGEDEADEKAKFWNCVEIFRIDDSTPKEDYRKRRNQFVTWFNEFFEQNGTANVLLSDIFDNFYAKEAQTLQSNLTYINKYVAKPDAERKIDMQRLQDFLTKYKNLDETFEHGMDFEQILSTYHLLENQSKEINEFFVTVEHMKTRIETLDFASYEEFKIKVELLKNPKPNVIRQCVEYAAVMDKTLETFETLPENTPGVVEEFKSFISWLKVLVSLCKIQDQASKEDEKTLSKIEEYITKYIERLQSCHVALDLENFSVVFEPIDLSKREQQNTKLDILEFYLQNSATKMVETRSNEWEELSKQDLTTIGHVQKRSPILDVFCDVVSAIQNNILQRFDDHFTEIAKTLAHKKSANSQLLEITREIINALQNLHEEIFDERPLKLSLLQTTSSLAAVFLEAEFLVDNNAIFSFATKHVQLLQVPFGGNTLKTVLNRKLGSEDKINKQISPLIQDLKALYGDSEDLEALTKVQKLLEMLVTDSFIGQGKENYM